VIQIIFGSKILNTYVGATTTKISPYIAEGWNVGVEKKRTYSGMAVALGSTQLNSVSTRRQKLAEVESILICDQVRAHSVSFSLKMK